MQILITLLLTTLCRVILPSGEMAGLPICIIFAKPKEIAINFKSVTGEAPCSYV